MGKNNNYHLLNPVVCQAQVRYWTKITLGSGIIVIQIIGLKYDKGLFFSLT